MVTEQTVDVTEIPLNRRASKALDEGISIIDRVRLSLQSYGTREIHASVDDLASRAGLTPSQFYQAVYRLKDEYEVLKEKNHETGREKIIGIKINKGIDPIKTIQNGAEKAKTESSMKKKMSAPKVASSLTHLQSYMDKRIVMEKARQSLLDAGFDEETVNDRFEGMFTPDPIGEEAIAIYSELTETKATLAQVQIDLEACRRISKFETTESPEA